MPLVFSDSVSFNKFKEISFYFVSERNADVLFGSAGCADSARSYLCLDVQDELILNAGCSADELRSEIKRFCFADERPAVGYLSYECGHVLRDVSSCKAVEYPCVHLKKYAAIIEYDALSGSLEFVHGEELFRIETERLIRNSPPVPEVELPRFEAGSGHMSLNEEAYRDGVAQTLEYIRDGLTYQLNLTTKFVFPAAGVDPVQWFFTLHDRFPAAYYALFRSGGKTILSTSPELFLRVDGGRVCSEPIKGTFKFDAYSANLEDKLVSSAKEDAELSMIVDLVRNDISADCRYGSVVVERHKSVFAVDNLLQMYSRVCGDLGDRSDCIDLLLNAYPGGSITGCPKKSSMELINSLEPHTRGPYCGSLVLIRSPRDLVASIAIRTAVYDHDQDEIAYWAGSGIVIDSQPEAEYLETMAKAGKILNPELL